MNNATATLAAVELAGGSCFLALVGQVAPDALSGGAGWVGTGLLGVVLAWVFFTHLPAKDRQLKEIIEGKDATATADREAFRKTLKEVEDANERRSLAEDSRIAALIDATDARGVKMQMMFTEETERQRRTFAGETAEMRNMVLQVIASGRTMIHDARDLASNTVNAAEVIRREAAKEKDKGT